MSLFKHACYLSVCLCVCVCALRTKRLPVLYVFGREQVCPEECVAALRGAFPDQEEHVLVLYDVVYAHCMGECSG